METVTKSQMNHVAKLTVVIFSALVITGCAEFGGKQLSLLQSSRVLDPLEVPPGLSPLPEAEQFQIPGEYNPAELAPEDLSPEQFRNYGTWVEFEKFQEFQRADKGIGVDADQYREAVERGEDFFKVTVIDTGENAIRLRVVDSAQAVFERMKVALHNMDVKVNSADEEIGKFVVSGVDIKKLPTLLQRIGFKEYKGRIDELHVVTTSATETQVVAKTEFNVEVNAEGSKEFLTRLRYYLLTSYQQDESGTALASAVSNKSITVIEGRQTIVISENFDSAWVRVGRTLEASGVNIDDLDRSQGLYLVSFSHLEKDKKKRWRLAFWRKDKKEVAQKHFRVLVTDHGSQTRIHVEGSGDDESDDQYGEQLLGIIYERLLT
ncbi:MAG: outer membrane protein assembly factor BamC [Acidiferrobacterales bacterium]|nr:outer membrane protein assembly factor BamC [Acidiferrobacterales bacterium]